MSVEREASKAEIQAMWADLISAAKTFAGKYRLLSNGVTVDRKAWEEMERTFPVPPSREISS